MSINKQTSNMIFGQKSKPCPAWLPPPSVCECAFEWLNVRQEDRKKRRQCYEGSPLTLRTRHEAPRGRLTCPPASRSAPAPPGPPACDPASPPAPSAGRPSPRPAPPPPPQSRPRAPRTSGSPGSPPRWPWFLRCWAGLWGSWATPLGGGDKRPGVRGTGDRGTIGLEMDQS